ncbi:DUF262 domain-containing protein [Lachnospiraceae bacterium MD1]|uniref:DUF262 domain-containing protein n=1 Tax=Variimorphobacter saccharofermentans TaxID=2755051 RepID=A0A839JVT3_9FIRM|nr:DUF262 domain-containing protein [Variimorphobacter saccharofermentans]MBB2181775.1 DUF262 domain-containing protein [Variimorphobacter saccharofermentans]
MRTASGMKKVSEFFDRGQTIIYDAIGGRKQEVFLDENRVYLIPGYQREIRWSSENVQILIDDLGKGGKFLGTITLSTFENGKYEVIDGQQRITVITLLISYLNTVVPDRKKHTNICKIENGSFTKFGEALSYGFNYKRIEKDNLPLYAEILETDVLDQRDDFAIIWNSIVERVQVMSEDEQIDLFVALEESEINVIVNEIDGTGSQRKFCIDYFIDINNKSVELDSIDIIRAYAFKEDFEKMTALWIDVQNKCNALRGVVKYSREELYYQYFICKVNGELDYQLTRSLGENYTTKENVKIGEKRYASGTFVWNMFSKDRFYAQLLEDLNAYLDFITLVISHENGGNNEFKSMFYLNEENRISETQILNTHTVINCILRNDDVVPKMMIMKYYLEVLKPQTAEKKMYKCIYDINAVATIFTATGKKKESEQIANKLLQQNWGNAIKEYAYKQLRSLPEAVDFAKVALFNKKHTVESGQYLARRYFSLYDAYDWLNGNVSVDEEQYKNANITNGNNNMEHFIINRNYEYALYLDDGSTCDIEIKIPVKFKKYIATIANYLILNSRVNSNLKNRPVYEKIEIIEEDIRDNGIDYVIPSKRSQLHYFVIKEIFHDLSKYPVKELKVETKKSKKKKLLRDYYLSYFEEEYTQLTQSLASEEKVFVAEMEYYLSQHGFFKDGDRMILSGDSGVFLHVEAEIDEKKRKIEFYAELGNPYFAETGECSEEYIALVEAVDEKFTQIMEEEPCISSSDEYCECPDVSYTFSFQCAPNVEKIEQFLKAIEEMEAVLCKMSETID